jgi:hypothetical protein
MTFDPTNPADRSTIRLVCDSFPETRMPASGIAQPNPVDAPSIPDPVAAPNQGSEAQANALKAQRQQQAAAARAAKAAKDKPRDAAPPADVAGGTNGAGDQPDDDTDDMGLASPSMSPGEAKDAALALVREVYSAGHVPQVKALQKELNVAKFYDVPVESGHAFYQRVVKLAQGVGLRT